MAFFSQPLLNFFLASPLLALDLGQLHPAKLDEPNGSSRMTSLAVMLRHDEAQHGEERMWQLVLAAEKWRRSGGAQLALTRGAGVELRRRSSGSGGDGAWRGKDGARAGATRWSSVGSGG